MEIDTLREKLEHAESAKSEYDEMKANFETRRIELQRVCDNTKKCREDMVNELKERNAEMIYEKEQLQSQIEMQETTIAQQKKSLQEWNAWYKVNGETKQETTPDPATCKAAQVKEEPQANEPGQSSNSQPPNDDKMPPVPPPGGPPGPGGPGGPGGGGGGGGDSPPHNKRIKGKEAAWWRRR